MVMDFVQGGTLGEHLKTHGKMPVDDTLRLAHQLANGLASAHAQGIIHRDIKPSNILFVDESNSQVVLTDFGLASLREDAEASLTLTGAMVGTPTYMSPEAVVGEVSDARSDIYSLGVVIYEMLTGRPPYMANTPYSMMMKQTTEPLPSPRKLNPALPSVVENLLLKALAKEPAERHQSADELIADIRRTQQLLWQGETPQPSVGAPASPAAVRHSQTSSPAKTNDWLSLAIGLSGIVLVAFLTAELLLHL
jgi:eukaryotic-like serine/threonine-protein kinase